MKHKILLLLFIPYLSFAQTGINTTDPRTTLDVNGAVTHRQVNFTVASNAVNINTETSLANITGAATGTVTVTLAYTPTINGHLLTISNNTTGGFGATFAGTTIPNGQAISFVYTNGAWKTTIGSSIVSPNLYNSDGILTGNRTVALGANTLTFTGAGRVEFANWFGFAKDTRMGISTIYNINNGDAFGMEQVSGGQTGTNAALRLFTANVGAAYLAFGKYTTATAFSEYARFNPNGYFGIWTGGGASSTFHVNGSIATSIVVISGDLLLAVNHKTAIIPLGSAFTVTLPAASGITGRVYTIVNNTVGAKTIGNYIDLVGNTVNTIGAASSVEVQSDGTSWRQIQ